MALTDAFKLPIDAQLRAIELVTPLLAKTQNFKVLSAPHRETKAENIYYCPNGRESCGPFIHTNLFKN